MRQQVNLNVDLTYDVDATLTREQIMALVTVDLGRLENFGAEFRQVEFVGSSISNLLEEAEIYS
jgi:hypothetical protein